MVWEKTYTVWIFQKGGPYVLVGVFHCNKMPESILLHSLGLRTIPYENVHWSSVFFLHLRPKKRESEASEREKGFLRSGEDERPRFEVLLHHQERRNPRAQRRAQFPVQGTIRSISFFILIIHRFLWSHQIRRQCSVFLIVGVIFYCIGLEFDEIDLLEIGAIFFLFFILFFRETCFWSQP